MSQGHIDVSSQVYDPALCDSSAAQTCTILEILNRISGKWSIGILLVTMQGPARFTELEREVKGISRRMLTLTLRNLERDGLIVRTVYPTIPPKVEYTATEIAGELYETLLSLTSWAERHQEQISVARLAYDTAAATAQPPSISK